MPRHACSSVFAWFCLGPTSLGCFSGWGNFADPTCRFRTFRPCLRLAIAFSCGFVQSVLRWCLFALHVPSCLPCSHLGPTRLECFLAGEFSSAPTCRSRTLRPCLCCAMVDHCELALLACSTAGFFGFIFHSSARIAALSFRMFFLCFFLHLRTTCQVVSQLVSSQLSRLLFAGALWCCVDVYSVLWICGARQPCCYACWAVIGPKRWPKPVLCVFWGLSGCFLGAET